MVDVGVMVGSCTVGLVPVCAVGLHVESRFVWDRLICIVLVTIELTLPKSLNSIKYAGIHAPGPT